MCVFCEYVRVFVFSEYMCACFVGMCEFCEYVYVFCEYVCVFYEYVCVFYEYGCVFYEYGCVCLLYFVSIGCQFHLTVSMQAL